MVIRVIPAAPRRPSKGERIGQALSGALMAGLGAYEQHKKKQRYNEALGNIERIYGDPNLNDQQKIVKVYQQLSEHPELAKQLGGQLSQYGKKPLNALEEEQLRQLKSEEDYLSKLMGNGRQASEDQPVMNNARPGRTFEDEFGATSEKEEPEESFTPSRTKAKPQFNYQDPSTWSNKQIDEFRAIEGKSAKAKSLANRAQNEYDRRQETKQATKKYQENIAPLEGALETLDRMEKIGKKGNLGVGTSVRGVLSPNARREASEYERLGKSLISFASNIPIRNRQEFEVLAHDLYDPSISDASREGILTAMKRIIQSSMQQYEQPEEEEGVSARQSRQPAKKERPPLTSFLK